MGFVEGVDRGQALVRNVDAFVGGLELAKLDFGRVVAAHTGAAGLPAWAPDKEGSRYRKLASALAYELCPRLGLKDHRPMRFASARPEADFGR
jgi:hypothetical protein